MVLGFYVSFFVWNYLVRDNEFACLHGISCLNAYNIHPTWERAAVELIIMGSFTLGDLFPCHHPSIKINNTNGNW